MGAGGGGGSGGGGGAAGSSGVKNNGKENLGERYGEYGSSKEYWDHNDGKRQRGKQVRPRY